MEAAATQINQEGAIAEIANTESGSQDSSAAWGSLEGDNGSYPKHVRKVKLARFDPKSPPKAPKRPAPTSKYSPCDFEFWESTDVFLLSEEQQFFAKKVYHEGSRCVYIHLGKRTPKSIQRLRFTEYEAKKMRPFIEKILIQIDRHQRAGKDESHPLEFLADDPCRAFEFNPKYVREFWRADADMETCNLKVRVQFNQRNGRWEMGFLNPVPESTCDRFNNWAGPCMWLDTEVLTGLLTFIDEPIPETNE